MKCAWPKRRFCVGGNTNFMYRVGGNANLAFLDTNMLVYPTQNFDPAQVFLRRSGI